MRPRTSYNFFFRKVRQEIQVEIQELAGRRPLYSEVSKLVAARWKQAGKAEKAYYATLAAKDKRRYALELIEYRSKPSATSVEPPLDSFTQQTGGLSSHQVQDQGSQSVANNSNRVVSRHEGPRVSPNNGQRRHPFRNSGSGGRASLPRNQNQVCIPQEQLQALAQLVQQPGMAQSLMIVLSVLQGVNQGDNNSQSAEFEEAMDDSFSPNIFDDDF